MNFTAQANYIRISPRKVGLVSSLILGLSVSDAEAQLAHSAKNAAEPVLKLLASAVANTLDQMNIKKEDLYIKEITVNDGPTLHRFHPRAFGRAGRIRKRTSHIRLTLGVRKESGIDLEKAKKKQKIIAKPKTIKDLEKEAKQLEKGSASSEKKATDADSNAGTEAKTDSLSQSKTPHIDKKYAGEKGGSKGTSQKFMKKIFSRKVG